MQVRVYFDGGNCYVKDFKRGFEMQPMLHLFLEVHLSKLPEGLYESPYYSGCASETGY